MGIPARFVTCSAEDQAAVVKDDDERLPSSPGVTQHQERSPIVTSFLTANARAECLIPKQEARLLTQELPGDSWEQLVSHGAVGWESQSLGSALVEGRLSLLRLSPPAQAPAPSGAMGGRGGGVRVH